MNDYNKRGSLTIIFGPMKASKTEKLKSYLSMHNAMNHECLIISSVLDNRNETGELTGTGVLTCHNPHSSRLSTSIDQIKYSKLNEVDIMLLNSHDVIAIDEAQFFPDILLVLDWVNLLGKNVYVAGLLASSEAQMFGDLYKLLPYANKIKHLKACCPVCQYEVAGYIFTPATMTKCLVNKSNTIMVSANSYIPLCYYHWYRWETDNWKYDSIKNIVYQ